MPHCLKPVIWKTSQAHPPKSNDCCREDSYLPCLWPSATAGVTRPGTLQLQAAGTQTTSLAGGSLKEGDKLEIKVVPSM